MYRHLRAFSTHGRRLARVSVPVQNSGDFQVQRVRFVRPFLPRRVWLKSFVYSSAATYIWMRWTALDEEEDEETEETPDEREGRGIVKSVPEVEHAGIPGNAARDSGAQEGRGAQEGEEEEEYDEDELVPEDQPEDAWFIPLWMAKEKPMSFYKATDPEWAAYVQFNQNFRKRNEAKMKLCQILGKTFNNMKDFQNMLGGPLLIGKQWLEFFYPHGPPPEWERLGIEIADEYIAILHRPVESRNVDRLNGALWPVVAGQSMWASCHALWQLQVARFRTVWNSMDSDPEKWRTQYQESMRKVLNAHTRPRSSGKSGTSGDPTPSVQISSKPSQLEQSLSLPLPSLPQPNGDLKKATQVFRGSFAKNTKLNVHPPRGTLVVTGLVEMVGTKATCIMDVQASYDPQEARYITIHVAPRRAKQRRIMPKG